MLNSIGVILAASIVYYNPDLWWVDPLCTYFFAIIVVYTTKDTFWSCIKLLLEATPDMVDQDEIEESLKKLEGVAYCYDLHVWGVSQEKFALTVHIVLKDSHQFKQQQVLIQADKLIRNKFNINHIVIQIEASEPVEETSASNQDNGMIRNFRSDLHQ